MIIIVIAFTTEIVTNFNRKCGNCNCNWNSNRNSNGNYNDYNFRSSIMERK